MEPKTYFKDDHGIDINLIDKDALYVLDRLRLAGHEAYLVGGSVRDLLLGHIPKDFDISTSAKPEEVKKIFRSCLLIGRRFRLAHVRFGRKIIEVATFRAGDLEDDSLIVRDNVFGTAEEDVMRRDFTINGLYYDSENESVIDYVGGYPDAEKKLLRTIGQPYIRFKQDPVRMIRLLKFQARFGLDVEPEAHQALLECRSEILKSSPSRILEELLRMLESGSAANFFKLMADHGVLTQIMPAVGEFLEKPEGGDIYSFLEELDSSVSEPHRPVHDRAVMISCLLFPLFEHRIKVHFVDREKSPHLGELFEEANKAIDDVFRPFFSFPRRLRAFSASILTNQYRLTPLDPKRYRRIRVPKFAEFPLAVDFFSFRANLEPALKTTFEEWHEAVKHLPPPPKKKPVRRRSRGRSRRPS